MKYYSEILNKNFDTVEDLEAAEKVEKKKGLAKAKGDAARKAEIEAAKKKRDEARADYEAALKVCREALSRWSAAEKEFVAVERKNSPVINPSQLNDDFIELVKKWGLRNVFSI